MSTTGKLPSIPKTWYFGKGNPWTTVNLGIHVRFQGCVSMCTQMTSNDHKSDKSDKSDKRSMSHHFTELFFSHPMLQSVFFHYFWNHFPVRQLKHGFPPTSLPPLRNTKLPTKICQQFSCGGKRGEFQHSESRQMGGNFSWFNARWSSEGVWGGWGQNEVFFVAFTDCN